jgi:ABC-type polysaccharide/polyol phosphate transport system ATPase subunit
MDNNIVIKLENISKTFHIKDRSSDTIRDKVMNIFNPSTSREIKALDNINIEIKRGEFFGIIGRNGSGKSTLLQIMTGAYPPDKGGKATINGKYMRLSLGMGFDKELTARENIYTSASIMGLTFKKIGQKFYEMIQFAELEKFVDTKVKYFSSGMRSRLSFAIAIHAEAEILLMDEFFGGVGDAKFKEKSEEVFKDRILEGRTIVHVSHQPKTIKDHCERVLLLHHGKPIMIDTPDIVFKEYHKLLKLK